MGDKKVLIVEDDEDLQTLYGLYLQGESFEICKAYNGIQAIDAVQKFCPDVIVLDMIMPKMDGEAFFLYLRTQLRITNVPVIIASVNEKIPPQMYAHGIQATLRKPFTVEILVDKIREALANSETAAPHKIMSRLKPPKENK